MQREANRICGYTAKQTLDYAQSLYERKLITYPRTDSRYLTSDMADTTADVIQKAANLPPFDDAPDFSPDVTVLLSDKDVSDHHAIIPTMAVGIADLHALPVGERTLFLLICSKLLCAAAASYVYETVTAIFECSGYHFTAKGTCIITEGWKAFERLLRASLKEKPEDAGEDESNLPELFQGKVFERAIATITEHYTAPPKPYTEDTLLSAMEHAGKEDMPEDAERKGLGTPATRASIIEKLVSSGFAQRKGKSLIPTHDGINLITILPETLTSPLLTAEWEQRLSEIAKGSANQQVFMDDIQKMAAELVATYTHISEDGKKLFAPQKEPVGTCPRCREQVYEGKKNFYCGNRGCGFVLWKNDRFWLSRKKELTKKMAADFKTPELFAMVNDQVIAIPVLAAEQMATVILPDDSQTGERIQTPRGSFSVTDMTREQMEVAGYGYHHSSEDGRYHIMGNGTRAFAIASENHLKNAEMVMEDDYGMIDGIINNGSKEAIPPGGADEKPSIRERLSEAKQECQERKPPEIMKPEKSKPEHDL